MERYIGDKTDKILCPQELTLQSKTQEGPQRVRVREVRAMYNKAGRATDMLTGGVQS